MKRSGPLKRRAPLRTTSRLRRTPLRPISKKRKEQLPERQKVIDEVIARDGGCVAEGLPGVPHGPLPDRKPLEVHELKRGSGRASAWLDADWCIALCPQAHDWVTENIPEAKLLGLAVSAFADEAERDEAAARRK